MGTNLVNVSYLIRLNRLMSAIFQTAPVLILMLAQDSRAAAMSEATLRDCPVSPTAVDFTGIANPDLARCLRDCGIDHDAEMEDCYGGVQKPFRLFNQGGELTGFYTTSGARCNGGVYNPQADGSYSVPTDIAARDRCPILVSAVFIPTCPAEETGGAQMPKCRSAQLIRFRWTLEQVGETTLWPGKLKTITTDDVNLPSQAFTPNQILRQNAAENSCGPKEVAVSVRPDGTPICIANKDDELICSTILAKWVKIGYQPPGALAALSSPGQPCAGVADPAHSLNSLYTKAQALPLTP